jgi:hypothetical protein
MRIDIDDKHCITSDSLQMIVNEKSISKGEKTAGQEVLRPIAYVGTLHECYNYLLHRKIRESKANGFKELMKEVARIEKALSDSIKI